MSSGSSIPLVLVLNGFVSVIALALAGVAYIKYKDSEFQKMLLPLIVATVIFALSHGLLYLWPQHPPLLNILEPLSYTLIAAGIFRLVYLHPTIDHIVHGDKR